MSLVNDVIASDLQFSIDAECNNNLNHLCSQCNVSLTATLLSCFKILVYRHTNQPDFAIEYSNRNSKEIGADVKKDQSIQIKLSSNPLFTDLLREVQQIIDSTITLQAAGNPVQSFASENGEEVCSTPKAIFIFTNEADFEVRKNNAFRNNFKIFTPGDSVELKLTLASDGYRIEGMMEYNEKFFDAEHVIRMIEHFQVLLNEINHDPTQRIAHIRLLKEAELNKLLFEWNNTDTDFPHDKCIHELFEEQVKIFPQAVAATLHSGVKQSLNKWGRQITYSELDQKANQAAHYLQNLGVGPDVVVGIFMNRSLEMVVALLGILKAGGTYLPIDTGQPRERIDFILKDSGITILLSQYHLMSKLPVLEKRVIYLEEEWHKIQTYSGDKPTIQTSPENLAYVIYTSGSTGLPKGTLITHRGVVNYLTWCIKAYNVAAGDGAPVNSSLGFDATVTSFLSPLLTGKKVVLLPEDGEIEALVDVLQSKNTFSLVKITPAHLEILSNLLTGKNFLQQTNAFVIGGEALKGKSLKLLRKPGSGARFINEYGPTETVVGCCVYEVSADDLLTDDIPIGRPIANTQIYLLDDYMQPVPIGVPGEIYIGGAGLARGYLNRPELTLERFVSNPFSEDAGKRLYKTGDIARYLNDGNILFMGRKDNQVKIRGYRVELAEIEHAIQNTGFAGQAVALAKEKQDGDKVIIGYYVPDEAILRSKEKELQFDRVANWKELYEIEYGQTENDEKVDPEFNIIGWNDSFTGNAIPAEDMKQWLDDIVGVVLAEPPGNVLEIGCGSGLIYYQLAGKVNKYIGSDLSKSSINQVRQRISKGLRNYGDTELFTAPAHEVHVEGQQVDTVLMNSIIQYFPGQDYLDLVIDRCFGLIQNKGRIILGDVLDNRLHPYFKARLRLQKLQDAIPIKDFHWGQEHDLLNEEELCVAPGYFYTLKNRYPQITDIEIQWKQGDYINELTLYRYTVVMYVGIEKTHLLPNWQGWNDNISSKTLFAQSNEPILAIKDVPNPRLGKERLLQQELATSRFKTTGELKVALDKEGAEDVQLQSLVNSAAANGYTTKFLVHADPFLMYVVFEKEANKAFIQLPVSSTVQGKTEPHTNIPLFTDITFLLQKSIRQQLLKSLPEYMVPAELVAYRQMPLTINGKIDHTALQVPNKLRLDPQKAFVAGRNKLEIQLTKLFENCMGITSISVQDDVFELGINSVQAYRLFAQIRKTTGLQLPLSILIQAPTIEKLAIYLEGEEVKLPWSCIVPVQPKGSKPPLFLVHAGGGTVLFYHELAKHLGPDQPVYGIQPKGVDGKQSFHTSVEEMAGHYINEIISFDSKGPYLLGGYCFGAVIAFEMAQQLTARGLEVALLANFNGVSPTYNYSFHTGNDRENKKSHSLPQPGITWKKFAQKDTQEKLRYLSNKIDGKIVRPLRNKALFGAIGSFMLLNKFYHKFGLKTPQLVVEYYLWYNNGKMVNAYRPKPYSGTLTILRSPGLYGDPYLGWRKYVTGEIIVCDISGYHTNRRQIMNEPFVEFTAKELGRYIDKSLQA